MTAHEIRLVRRWKLAETQLPRRGGERRCVLPADGYYEWQATPDVRELIASVPSSVLQPYPVSKAVNNLRNNSPELLIPVTV